MALQHLRSNTANKRPDPTAMAEGQLALNTANASPGLFYKDATGSLIKAGPVHIGATAPNATPAAGGHAGNSVGEAWLDTSGTNPLLKIYNGASFVTVQPVASGTVVSTADTGSVTSTMILDGTIVNADINASAAIVDTKLATIATGGKVSNSATTATNANTASAIVARDASGNFTAGTITAALTGAASSNVLKAGDTMTGALVVPLASAATPSLTFTGDLNTGIFSPGADQVAISTNGSTKLSIDSGGNISFSACGLRAKQGRIFDADVSNANVIIFGGAGDGANIELYGGTHATVANLAVIDGDEIRFRNAAGSAERLRITSAGNVGIGTSAPKTTLNVVGDTSISANSFTSSNLYFDGAAFRFIANGHGGFIKQADSAGYMSFVMASAVNSSGADAAATVNTRMVITPAGRVGIGTTSPGNPLAISQTVSTTFGNAGTYLGLGGTENAPGQTVLIGFGYKNASGDEYPAVIGYIATSNAGNQNGAIVFGTRAVTTNTAPTERARIDSSGRLLVGTSSHSGANLLQVNTDALVNALTVGRGAGAISSNTAVGTSALAANTTGSSNTANGQNALRANTTGVNNTANGVDALRSNTTGNNNTANGVNALLSNTTGGDNTANGKEALRFNTTGINNTANGQNALRDNTTGGSNTANGVNALVFNTTGGDNTANGQNALRSNTTGISNTANGVNALYSNTTGAGNTANGRDALFSNTIGNSNTANGQGALFTNTTGGSNTAIGLEAGYGDGTQANTTGSNNTFIGFDAMGASATASNVITLGNGSIATLRCQVTTITSLSDARDKTNITNLPAGLDFINALRPVAFDWNTRDGKKVGIPEFGFIAQELQDAQASTGITVPNLVSAENPDKLEASAGTLLPVLVNAVQELTAMVKDLQAELSILKGA